MDNNNRRKKKKEKMLKKKRKRMLFGGCLYLAAFLISAGITNLVINYNTTHSSGISVGDGQTLVYAKVDDRLVNGMSGHLPEQSGAYIRDFITPVSGDGQVELYIEENNEMITGASYQIYDETMRKLVMEGNLEELTTEDTYKVAKIACGNALSSTKEYCLNLTLTNKDGESMVYCTRLKYSDQFNVSQKLSFALDFNQMTFDTGNQNVLSKYQDGTTSGKNQSLQNVRLDSDVNLITWGDLKPAVVGNIAVNIKEINESSGVFELMYDVSATTDGTTSIYKVTEYYTIDDHTEDQMLELSDYKRTMEEVNEGNSFKISNGVMRLGILDDKNMDLISYGIRQAQAEAETETTSKSQEVAYNTYISFISNDTLWMYNTADNLMTKVFVFNDSKNSNLIKGTQQYRIKTLRTEDNGDLLFMVYGYMYNGSHRGNMGILVYKYSAADNTLEEQLFIPYNGSFGEMDADISRLAFLDEENMFYLNIGSDIYKIDLKEFAYTKAWENITVGDFNISEDGRCVVIPEKTSEQGILSLRMIHLDTKEEVVISGEGGLVHVFGYMGDYLVCGFSQKDEKAVLDDVSEVVLYDQIRIVDGQNKVIKSYTPKEGYVSDATLNGNIVELSLVTKNDEGSYEISGNDYIVSNQKASEDEVSAFKADDEQGKVYIQMTDNLSQTPIAQTSRMMSVKQDKTLTLEQSIEQQNQYLMTAFDGTVTAYKEAGEAIQAADEGYGVVIDSNNHIIWQKNEISDRADTGISSIGTAGEEGSIPVVTSLLMSYIGVSKTMNVSGGQDMAQALAENTEKDILTIEGITLDEAKYYLYRGMPVVAETGDDTYVVLVKYEDEYIFWANPQEGIIQEVGQEYGQGLLSGKYYICLP